MKRHTLLPYMVNKEQSCSWHCGIRVGDTYSETLILIPVAILSVECIHAYSLFTYSGTCRFDCDGRWLNQVQQGGQAKWTPLFECHNILSSSWILIMCHPWMACSYQPTHESTTALLQLIIMLYSYYDIVFIFLLYITVKVNVNSQLMLINLLHINF